MQQASLLFLVILWPYAKMELIKSSGGSGNGNEMKWNEMKPVIPKTDKKCSASYNRLIALSYRTTGTFYRKSRETPSLPCWVFSFRNSLIQITAPTIAQIFVPYLEYCKWIRSAHLMYMYDAWLDMPKMFESLDFRMFQLLISWNRSDIIHLSLMVNCCGKYMHMESGLRVLNFLI